MVQVGVRKQDGINLFIAGSNVREKRLWQNGVDIIPELK
jgi:hypothetical protein